jgi:hypothetical protein
MLIAKLLNVDRVFFSLFFYANLLALIVQQFGTLIVSVYQFLQIV